MKQIKELISLFILIIAFFITKNFFNHSLSLSILFVFGVLIQIALLFDFSKWKKEDTYKIIAILIFASFGIFITGDSHLSQKFLAPTLLFVMTATLFFEKRILSILNEKTLLIINLIVIYLLIKNNFTSNWLLIYSIPTVLVIINSFINKQNKKWQEILLFLWYFILVLTIPIIHFNFDDLVNITMGNSTISLYQALALGASFCFVVINIVYIFSFVRVLPDIPTSKSSSNYNFTKKLNNPEIFNKQYDETIQFQPLHALFVIIFFGALLILNYFFNIISDSLLIVFVLFLTAMIANNSERK